MRMTKARTQITTSDLISIGFLAHIGIASEHKGQRSFDKDSKRPSSDPREGPRKHSNVIRSRGNQHHHERNSRRVTALRLKQF